MIFVWATLPGFASALRFAPPSGWPKQRLTPIIQCLVHNTPVCDRPSSPPGFCFLSFSRSSAKAGLVAANLFLPQLNCGPIGEVNAALNGKRRKALKPKSRIIVTGIARQTKTGAAHHD